MSKYILLRHRDTLGLKQLDVYRKNGGFKTFEKAIKTLEPSAVLGIIKDSGLRGRGGAGFPTGMKWSFLPDTLWPHYVVANADESEPGTFKDREILENNPYQFLEGLMLASFAVKAETSYIYLRGEFWQIASQIDSCIHELENADLLGNDLFGTGYSLKIYTHMGAGAYICGEETALLESLEGKLGQPRLRPPFPAVYGLFGKPTVINNVETLTNIPPIIEKGAAWYRQFGTEKSPGVKIFCLSGRVNKPGNYELPLGIPFRHLIYELGGGIIGGKQIKAIMTAGASSTIIPATEQALDTPMDYESIQNTLGAPLGSASVIILDETTNMASLVNKTVGFFQHESCGKCTPCREGTYWMNNLARRILETHDPQQVDLLLSVAKQIQNKCLCALGEFSTMAVVSAIQHFHEDFISDLRSFPSDAHKLEGLP